MDKRQIAQIRRDSRKQEKQAAEDIGGKVQANSGATRLGGGADVRLVGKLRLECKLTSQSSYTLKLRELLKLKKQAIETLEYPVFQFAFKYLNGQMKKYAVIPWSNNPPLSPNDHTFHLTSKQAVMVPTALDSFFLTGRVVVTFPDNKQFEIMHWNDFLERWKKQEEE